MVQLSAAGQTVTRAGSRRCDISLLETRSASILRAQHVILMRQDPPFDMGYITATHLLDMIHPKTLVVNNPTEVRNAPEKLFILNFKELMPPTLITRDLGRA